MKRSVMLMIAVLLVLAAVSTAACSKSKTESTAPAGNGTGTEKAGEKTSSSGSDEKENRWDSLNWYTAEVDTLGNSAVHVTFAFPENFGGYQETAADESYISYGSSTEYGEKEGLYRIIVSYYRNENGPTTELFPNLEGTHYETEINGKQLLADKSFNEEQQYYMYTYLADFGGPEKARVVIIIIDQEESGGFRAAFERRLQWN